MATDAADAAYQKEYYERTKQLKGRQPGKGYVSGGRDRAPAQAPPPDNKAARAAAAQRVKALNAKLTQLKAALQAARAKAPKSSPNDTPSKGESDAKKKAQNEEYYNKNKNEIANDRKAEARKSGSGGGAKGSESSESKPASRSVEEIETAIRNTLTELKAAIAKLKTL